MCVVALALAADPRWPLVVVGNRDEFHARPAARIASITSAWLAIPTACPAPCAWASRACIQASGSSSRPPV